jgi:primosomal protein N' (replication factor Y)
LGGDSEGGRDEGGARPLNPREPAGGTVEVLPDVTGLDRTFHYLAPAGSLPLPGTIVRVPLHGRRVRGWVVAASSSAPPGVELHQLYEIVSVGPPPEVVEVCRHSARRYAGRLRPLLVAASPDRVVRRLPAPVPSSVTAPGADRVSSGLPDHLAEAFGRAVAAGVAVLRLPPAAERLPVVEAALEHPAARAGPVLVLVEATEDVDRLASWLRRLGRSVACLPEEWALAATATTDVVIGTRNAAFAPATPSITLVLDAHATAYRSPRAPTFDAREVAAARARQLGRPAVLVTPCPSLELLEVPGRVLVSFPPAFERRGWGVIAVLDSRAEDPSERGYPARLVSWIREAAARGGGPVVCLLNRVGRARLLACASCRSLQRCPRCGAAQAQLARPPHGEVGDLACPRCGDAQPAICPSCGSARLRIARPGVSRAREQLAAVTGLEVGEMSGPAAMPPATPVIVGTQAALHRLRRAALVVWLDFDQELLAPRLRAAEDALALLARSARLVSRSAGGLVVVRTSLPGHEVVRAAALGDPGLVADAERQRRRLLSLPPYAGLAALSGEGAAALVARLPPSVTAVSHGARFLLRAASEEELAGVLSDLAGADPAGWAGLDVRVELNPVDL